jgi:hypothetical protein
VPVHDWTLVEAGIFHAFHTGWIGAIQNSLNGGLLPGGFYALAEQHFGRPITDVLTLHASPADVVPLPPLPPATGGTALAEAPPRTQRRQSFDPAALTHRRSLAVRHVSGHRLVALLEIVSPANKDREAHVHELADKIGSALAAGVHVLLVDLFPPAAHDPQGMHAAVLARMDLLDAPYDLPPAAPLSLAAYVAGPRVEVFANHLRVGESLTDMPLYLRPPQYVNVPLEETYLAAYRGMPAFWRDVLEGRPPAAR